MYLDKLEIQGFKSFANKTLLEFPKTGRRITAIVGPNGSGKSCVADSIRWVLGETSTKLLRAKKSADVIFSGSERKTRSGFAEATIYLDNSDRRAPVDYSEMAITRRLYRNGENEYFLNKKKVRLQDIILLLAQANFGQRTYSVIGQGMVDAVLLQSPRERKDFFDEAAGVRQFQIKRHSSINKLNNATDNLKQAEVLLAEINPRLRTLSRHVSKLEKYDEMKERLHSLEHVYYGNLWHSLNQQYTEQKNKIEEKSKKISSLNKEITELQNKFEQKESANRQKEGASDALLELQAKYNKLINKKNDLREKEFLNKQKIATFKLEQSRGKEISARTVAIELDDISKEYTKIINNIDEKTNPLKLKERLEKILGLMDELSAKIKNPESAIKVPEEFNTALEAILRDMKNIDEETRLLVTEMDSLRQKQKTETSEFFIVQRNWRDKIEEKNILDRNINDLKVESARIETKKESLETEMETHLKERKERVLSSPPQKEENTYQLESEINNLRYQLELIGGIDPETIKEYKETKERYDFLESESNDLRNAMKQLKEITKELDQQIKKQFDDSFKKINQEFGKYFGILFGGGKAELEITEISSNTPTTEETREQEQEQEIEEKKETEDIETTAGIEIFANPPGKKVKSVNMLSGGERALTSIALICAIISNNPSPFVVLDEVDAALDESNSIRFAKIIEQLTDKTQFVLISHNRATMMIADVLYGVTMGDDGVSQLLSLKLEEAEGLVNR